MNDVLYQLNQQTTLPFVVPGSSDCHYYTTDCHLSVDFIDVSALSYDKIRGTCLGLCLQSESPPVKVVILFVEPGRERRKRCLVGEAPTTDSVGNFVGAEVS